MVSIGECTVKVRFELDDQSKQELRDLIREEIAKQTPAPVPVRMEIYHPQVQPASTFYLSPGGEVRVDGRKVASSGSEAIIPLGDFLRLVDAGFQITGTFDITGPIVSGRPDDEPPEPVGARIPS